MVKGSAQACFDSEGKDAYTTVRSQPNGDKSERTYKNSLDQKYLQEAK